MDEPGGCAHPNGKTRYAASLRFLKNPLSLAFRRIALPVIGVALLVALSGCDLLGGEEEGDSAVTTGVYVANQGNFSDGNGSVSVYDPQEETVDHPAVSDLGSIVQSITVTDERLYVMANTGPFVDAYTLEDLSQIGQATDLSGPRYMAVVSDNKAYVTNYTFGQPPTVSVLDVTSMEVTKTIDVNGSAGGVAVAAGRAYVAEGEFGADSTLAVVDTETDEITERINADCDSPRSVFADDEDDVWVVCTGVTMRDGDGNVTGRTNGAIRVLDGATGEITKRMDASSQLGGSQGAFYSAQAEEAYVIKSERQLIRLDTEDNTRTTTLGPLDGDPIGAVGYDARSRQLYVGHVPGFSSRGDVTIHERNGEQTGSFTAGVAPTYITFRAEE
jgi:hypothetical protein